MIADHVLNVTDEWTSARFDDPLNVGPPLSPVLLAGMSTFNGPNTAGIRIRRLTRDGFQVKIEEEQSDDPETRHTEETVNYIAVRPGNIHDHAGRLIGEAGILLANQPGPATWRGLPLATNGGDRAVFLQVMSYEGSQPVHTRLDHEASAFKMEEWAYLDGRHTTELIGYVALEPGLHQLPATTSVDAVEVGRLNGINHTWSGAVDLEPVGSVVTHAQSFNGKDPVVTRSRTNFEPGAAPFQFEVRLQEEEAKGPHPAEEQIAYLAAGQLS